MCESDNKRSHVLAGVLSSLSAHAITSGLPLAALLKTNTLLEEFVASKPFPLMVSVKASELRILVFVEIVGWASVMFAIPFEEAGRVTLDQFESTVTSIFNMPALCGER